MTGKAHDDPAMIAMHSGTQSVTGGSRTNCCEYSINPLNPELNPICYLLELLAHHFLHVSRIRVKSLTPRLLMSYIYIYYIYIQGVTGGTKLRESVPYVKIYRYNPKHLYPNLNGYGDNGQRSLKL